MSPKHKALSFPAFVLLAGVALGSSGCASIVSHRSWPIVVDSAPQGATFEIRNRAGVVVRTGTTPEETMLDSGRGYFKRAEYTITLNKPGFEEKKERIATDLNAGWYLAGNLVSFNFAGWLWIDPQTGAMYSIDDLPVYELKPKKEVK